MTASLLKSLELFQLFLLILKTPWSEWSWFFLWPPIPPISILSLWELFQVYHLQLVTLPTLYSTIFSWLSLATPPYHPLLPAGPQGYIPYQYRAAVCRFELVILPLHVHVKDSKGVHHFWTHPYFSSNVPHVWFIQFWWFSWWVVGGCTTPTLWDAVSRTYSILLTAFLCSCHQDFSQYV